MKKASKEFFTFSTTSLAFCLKLYSSSPTLILLYSPGVTEKLMEPQTYPGSSGTRNLRDNLSDLKAQVAANKKGIDLITELIDEYSLVVVQAYMNHIQTNAEIAVRDMLKEIGSGTKERTGRTMLSAVDYMDDGTPIRLSVSIKDDGSAVFDFTGTGPEVYGNCNAPRAIILSAIIYCLRCMVGHDVPLNQVMSCAVLRCVVLCCSMLCCAAL